jgi:hypothetical protein
MSERKTEDIIWTEDSVTVTTRDEYGDIHSETVEHNGSSSSRNDALDTAMERAHNN